MIKINRYERIRSNKKRERAIVTGSDPVRLAKLLRQELQLAMFLTGDGSALGVRFHEGKDL